MGNWRHMSTKLTYVSRIQAEESDKKVDIPQVRDS